MADVCGISGLGDGGIYYACNFFEPDRERRQGARVFSSSPRARSATTPTGTTSRRTSASPGGRTCRAAGCAPLLGDPEQATLRGGYSVAYERQGMAEFTGVVRRQPGQHAQPDPQRTAGGSSPPGRRWPVLLQRDAIGSTTRRFPQTPTFPIAIRGRTGPTASTPSTRTSRSRRRAPGRSASSARSRRNMAIDVRYVGTRGVNQWSELNYNERNLIENGFFNEFRLAHGEPAGQQRLGRRRPHRVVRLLRSRHGHAPAADLPRLSERLARCHQSGGLHGRHQHLDQHDASPAGSSGTIRARPARPPISTAT